MVVVDGHQQEGSWTEWHEQTFNECKKNVCKGDDDTTTTTLLWRNINNVIKLLKGIFILSLTRLKDQNIFTYVLCISWVIIVSMVIVRYE